MNGNTVGNGSKIGWGRPKLGTVSESVRVNFLVTPLQKDYLDKRSQAHGVPFAFYLRNLIDSDMCADQSVDQKNATTDIQDNGGVA